VWHQQIPGWLKSGNFDNKTMISILQNHIKNVVGHFKGKCHAWDVVNEALDVSSGKWRQDSIWQKTIGEAYIPLAFKAAAEADPGAKLYYNDFNTDWEGDKVQGVRKIVKMLKASDGITQLNGR
jgi:endo-1,4-beta-xylanase